MHTLLKYLRLPYRGTSLTRKCTPLGPYRRPMPRVLGGEGLFLVSEVPLYFANETMANVDVLIPVSKTGKH